MLLAGNNDDGKRSIKAMLYTCSNF